MLVVCIVAASPTRLLPHPIARSGLRALVSAVLLLLTVPGCTTVAPRYGFAPENVQTLRDAGTTSVRLGDFTVAPGLPSATRVSLRLNPMVSPYGTGCADYLREAIRQEFAEAGRLSSNAQTELSGILLRNDVDATGMIRGQANLSARIVVKRAAETVYDRVYMAETSWDSNYVGAIAIPRAVNAYPELVHRFVASLIGDAAFLAAIR